MAPGGFILRYPFWLWCPMNRLPAAALAVIFTIATLVIILGQARTTGLNINHLYIVIALAGALGAGHFIRETKSWASKLGFAVIFVAGTIISVGFSGGRSAAVMEHSRAQATTTNSSTAEIKRIAKAKVDTAQRAHDDAERDYLDKKATAALQCKSGDGTRCKGEEKSREGAKADLDTRRTALTEAEKAYTALLVGEKPPETGNAEFLHVAEFIAYIARATSEEAMRGIILFLPYILALLVEFGTIMFWGHAARPLPAITAHVPNNTPDQRPSAPLLVTSADIARDLHLDPKDLRKRLRAHRIPKPTHGAWAWTQVEAETIKARLSSGPTAGNA